MKKIIQKAFNVPEIAEFYSDFNHDKRAYVTVKIDAGYGSDFDLEEYEFHLDDNFAKFLFDFLATNLDKRGETDLQKFRIDPFERYEF